MALRLLARGYYPPWLSLVFETLRMPAVIPALGEIFKTTKVRFKVTPKGRVDGNRNRAKSPPLIVGLLALSVFAFVWFGLTLGGLTPVTYSIPGAMYGTVFFLFGNFALLVAAARRIMAPHHASERRASVRFPVSMLVTIDGKPAIVEDASLTGVGARLLGPFDLPRWLKTGPREFVEGETVTLDFVHQGLRFKARVVRSTGDKWNGFNLGLEFDDGQWSTVRDLALVLFHGNRPAKSLVDLRRDRVTFTAVEEQGYVALAADPWGDGWVLPTVQELTAVGWPGERPKPYLDVRELESEPTAGEQNEHPDPRQVAEEG
jgi:hypothetical protein